MHAFGNGASSVFDEFVESMTKLPVLARFAIGLAFILVVPHLCKRIRLPAVVGLVMAGVVLGPSGLHIAPKHGEVAAFFADVGKILLMFFAGLEIDLNQFNRSRNRSLGFGLATFTFPLAAGFAAGLGFGNGVIASLLIGSLLASHTLLGFPIVQRLGLVRNEAVTVTIGATVFTDIASLLILAVCIPIHQSGFSARAFTIQVVQLAVFIPLVLVGLSAAAQFLIGRFHGVKDAQLLVMLLLVVVAAIGAEVINLEGIIGAFLAGLALNRAVQQTEAKEELEFLGNLLFIPMFFLTVGFLIDVRVFLETIVSNFGLVAAIVGGLLVGKLLAAVVAQRTFGYSRDQGLIMWSLSLPQVAATLAAALVAYECKDPDGRRLIGAPVLNTVIVLMVVTSLLGPVLTEQIGRRLVASDAANAKSDSQPVAELIEMDKKTKNEGAAEPPPGPADLKKNTDSALGVG
jgi:Kef-type K+ transport system membrane component KefB